MLEYFGQFYGPTFYYCSSLFWFQWDLSSHRLITNHIIPYPLSQ